MTPFWLPAHDKDPIDQAYLARTDKILLAIGLLGFGTSLYALVLHLKLKIQKGVPLACDINEIASCSKIIGSRYGELLGVPLGALGMTFFAILLTTTVLPLWTPVSRRYLSFYQLAFSAVGLVVALGAAFIAYVVLHGVCVVCSTIQTATLLYFCYALFLHLKNRGTPLFADPRSGWRVWSVGAIFGASSLLAGYLSSVAAQAFMPPAVQLPVTLQQSAANETVAQFSRGAAGAPEDFRKGSDNAPLALVEFTDFECPFCRELHKKLKEIQSRIGNDRLLIVFRSWPIPYHKYARALAVAARCAGMQGKFWLYADKIFDAAQKAADLPEQKEHLLGATGIDFIADEVDLDMARFHACLMDPAIQAKIDEYTAKAKDLGGKGTPFVLIAGVPFAGNWMEGDTLEKFLRDSLSTLERK